MGLYRRREIATCLGAFSGDATATRAHLIENGMCGDHQEHTTIATSDEIYYATTYQLYDGLAIVYDGEVVSCR